MSSFQFKTQTPGTPIVVRRGDGTSAASGTTDSQGVFTVDLPSGQSSYVGNYGNPPLGWVGGTRVQYDTPDGGGSTPTLPKIALAPVGYEQPVSGRSATAFNQALAVGVTSKGFDLFFPLIDAAQTSVVLPFSGGQFVSQASGAPDVEGMSSLTVTAAVVKNDGTKQRITFAGQASVVIPRGGRVWCDPITLDSTMKRTSTDVLSGTALTGKTGITIESYVTVPADVTRASSGVTSGSNTVTDTGADVSWTGRLVVGTGIPAAAYVTNVIANTSYQLASNPTAGLATLVNATATGTPTLTLRALLPCNYNRLSQYDQASADNAADPTGTAGALATSAQNGAYGPEGVFGPAVKAGVGVTISDSIPRGLSDAYVYAGFMTRAAIELGYPMVNVGRGGQATQTIALPSNFRLSGPWLFGPSDLWIMEGTNDGVATTTAAALQLQDRIQQTIYRAKAAGVKRIGLCTIPPRTDASNVPVAGSQPTILAGINAWIRSHPDAFSVFEMHNLVSASPDSGTWFGGIGTTANVNGSGDGVHPLAWLMSGALLVEAKRVITLHQAAA